MRRVEAGESFVVTHNGLPIADLVSHAAPPPNATGDVSRPYVLDTGVVIDFEYIDFGDLVTDSALIAAVTVGELAYGADVGDAEQRARRRERLRTVLRDHGVLPFGVEETKLYGVLATLVRAAGRDPRPRRLDLQIAATAAAARLPLLTTNPDDFAGTEVLVEVVALRRAG